jgi:hypothetical protein
MGDRSLSELAQIIVDNDPEFMSRLRNCPVSSATSAKPNIFYCKPDTNVWSNMIPLAAQGLIASKLRTVVDLSMPEAHSAGSDRGRKELVKLVSAHVTADHQFIECLDRNPNLFAADNGVFDSSTGSIVFRAIKPDDMISKTAGWSYDPQMAAARRQDVDKFMKTIFPDDDERRIFLKFVATLLSGSRNVKRFVLLADTPGTEWNSGKTTLMHLLGGFFGRFCHYGGAKFLTRSQRDHGHDVGLQMKDGCRLLVADEVINRRYAIDNNMLRTVVDGPALVSGRAFRTRRLFSFFWQAGIILTCNEGGCPEGILTDQTLFNQRMLVIPMRTKFVCTEPKEPNEVRINQDIYKTFKDMRSALSDVFMELYDNRDEAFSDDNIPISMVQMKESFVE